MGILCLADATKPAISVSSGRHQTAHIGYVISLLSLKNKCQIVFQAPAPAEFRTIKSPQQLEVIAGFLESGCLFLIASRTGRNGGLCGRSPQLEVDPGRYPPDTTGGAHANAPGIVTVAGFCPELQCKCTITLVRADTHSHPPFASFQRRGHGSRHRHAHGDA